jgi:anaerobic selenocysteine-containing dehydrogenase
MDAWIGRLLGTLREHGLYDDTLIVLVSDHGDEFADHDPGAIYDIDQTTIMGLDVRDKNIRVLDQSRIGAVLCGDAQDLQGGPPVTALFVQNTNPMVVAPQSLRVREGFSRSDLFVCVHEQFMTETAAMADIVLPATTFLEHDDIYKAGGHTYLQVTRKVIEPLEQCRSNHWVLCELARRLGAEHPGFEMSEWELIEDALRRSGRPDATSIHSQHWLDCVLDFDTMHYLDGFANEDKRFHFKPDWSKVGPNHAPMTVLPDHLANIDEADDERPFRMVTAPARNYLNTTFTETPTSISGEKRPTVLVHPQDMTDGNIESGDRVRIGNHQASVVVHATAFDGVQRGVVVVESIWPNHAFEEGVGINALISAEAGAPNGGAVYHDTAVWIRPA